jgi:hypothetical protein
LRSRAFVLASHTARQPRHFRASAGGARYAYDPAGNRTSITHPDGIWFGMWYDGLNRQYYLHANNSLGLIYAYFARHGGVSALGRPGIASWIGYDAVQRPQSLAHTAYTAASTDVAYSYIRNPNRITVTVD